MTSEGVAAWEQWRRRHLGLDRVDPDSWRIMPMLYRRLASQGIDGPELQQLQAAYRATWAANLRVFEAGADFISCLESVGIPTMVLKGGALVDLHYRDAGLRPMADVDVLVPTAVAPRAFEALERSGWLERSGIPFATQRVTRHAAAFVGPARQEVDLHWSALDVPGSDDEFWEAAVSARVGRASTLAMNPSDELLVLVVHGTGPFGAPVRWVADSLTVLATTGEAFDWDRLVHAAVGRGVTVRVGAGLRYLHEAFAAGVPKSVLDYLEEFPAPAHERLSHWALTHDLRHGATYVHQWDRWRRLQALLPAATAGDRGSEAGPVAGTFVEYLQWRWGLSTRSELAGRLARKVMQIARYGRSDPTGRPLDPSGGPGSAVPPPAARARHSALPRSARRVSGDLRASCVVLDRIDTVTAGVPWTSTRVCHLLFHLAASRYRPQILEVSCGFGKATTYLAAAAAQTGGFVRAVDGSAPMYRGRTVEGLLRDANVSASCDVTLGCDARWFLLDLLAKDPCLELDLAFIDCSHTVEVDAFVTLCAWTHLRAGGLLVLDDLDWVPARHDPTAAGYSRPTVAHVRVLFDYIRSLADSDSAGEWGYDEVGWPLGFVRKGGGSFLPLTDVLAHLGDQY